jgi:hypothetical protein
MVTIFPVIGHAGVAEDEPDQIGKARLGANIVRQDDDATLTGLAGSARPRRKKIGRYCAGLSMRLTPS